MNEPLPAAPTTGEWQVRLLPFLIFLIIVLTLLFSATNLYQAFAVNQHIRATPVVLNPEALAGDPRLALEQFAIANRYHQAHVVLMSRIYVIYIGFTTGMILALVGAAFILAKLSEPMTYLKAAAVSGNLDLATASPGLALAVLGTALMVVTILARAEVNVTDRALYVTRVESSALDASAVPSPDSILKEVLKGEAH